MPEINFNTFLAHKPNLVWERVSLKIPGIQGVVPYKVWQAFMTRDGKISIHIPRYFASIFYDDESGDIGTKLYANFMNAPKFDPKGRGQKLVDEIVIGKRDEVSDALVLETMHQRYGVMETDVSQVPSGTQIGAGSWRMNKELSEKILLKKTMFNKTDNMLAVVCLRKKTFLRGEDQYFVWVVAIPTTMGMAEAEHQGKVKPSFTDIKSAVADFYGTARELRSVGFTEEVEVPQWATSENWDFSAGLPLDVSKRILEELSAPVEEDDEEMPTLSPDEMFSVASFTGRTTKTAQDVSQYYQGPIPNLDELEQYVGTPNVEASQLRGIFGGVDDAVRLVNQFDSSLLKNVAFVYNFSGGGAYGVYMSALDEKIKNEKLKKLLKMDGYEVSDQPDGSFYATHPKKDSAQIDREIKAYRQKIGSGGATTFGIDMNKVVGAARADANEAGITDPNDQRWLGVLHLGATMAHEAVHSKGSHSEGPSEQTEAKFMAWAMPIINQERQKAYVSQGKQEAYSPLVVDPTQRRMASSSNWLQKAMASGGVVKQAQYGAQFLQNQNLVKNFGPAPWSSVFWQYGIGPVEQMLDAVRPQRTEASKLSFEGQLREQNKDNWTSSVDAGLHTEELLEPSRDSLIAYKTTETLMENSRERPLMLPVSPLKRKASYDSGKESVGYMCNLDIPKEDRVQLMDQEEDERTDPNKTLPRYNPEYGNPMSSEDGISMKWVDLNMQVESWDDAMEERPNLKTNPWQKAASKKDDGGHLARILECAMRCITSGKIRGTRFICKTGFLPFITKFFENDADIRIDVFGNDSHVNVWVVSDSISKDSVKQAESYACWKSESDADRNMYDYITGISKIRSEGISSMIDAVRQAMRDSGMERMLVCGDLPLAVKTGKEWNVVRTVDFCANDPDACVKIGEIVCESLGAEISDRGEFLVANWKCVTFRFMGDAGQDERQLVPEDAKDIEPVGMNLYGRLVTPLMLAIDVMTEAVVDMTGEAEPDTDAKVVRTAIPACNAVAANPFIMLDAIFLASAFGFAIDSEFIKAAAEAENFDCDARAVWATIRASGKGNCMAVAEEYGLGDALARLLGGKSCQCR